MPPITIRIPTQQELMQMQQDPNSLLAMYNAANQAKPAAGSPAATNVPGVSPGSTTSSPSIVTPVNVPQFTATDLPEVPKNDPAWITSMTEMVNQLNMQAQQKANEGRIPGGAGLESRSSANIGSALSGALPADVIRQIGQASAERGVMTGNPYGASTSADYLKSIGLNSLQLMNTGQDWLTSALGRNPAAPIFDPSRLIMTPLQEAQFGLERGNLSLNQMKAQADIANSNAQRQLQSDLANASNQLERDRLVWQYEQNRLQRENALKIAQMEAARRGSGYGGGGSGSGGNYGGSGSSGFAPATNWSSGPTISQPWSDPGNPANATNQAIAEWDDLLYGDLPAATPPANTYYNPNTNTSDYSPFGQYFTPGGGIDQGGMSQEELDWLYNVGG